MNKDTSDSFCHLKNKFKVLEKSKEKKIKKISKRKEILVQDLEGFTYIPPEAFYDISDREDHHYLKKGLYVSDLLCEWDNENYNRITNLVPTDCITKTGSVMDMNWFGAKMTADILDSKLMTLAEYLKILDWSQMMDDPLHKKLLKDPVEWLDGLVEKEFLRTHSDVQGNARGLVFDGFTRKIPRKYTQHGRPLSWEGDRHSYDPYTGFFKKETGGKINHFIIETGCKTGFLDKSGIYLNSDSRYRPIITINNGKGRTGFCTFRLCKKVKDSYILNEYFKEECNEGDAL